MRRISPLFTPRVSPRKTLIPVRPRLEELEGRDVVFAIGGADGLPEAALSTAERRWSLSRLTFPHELARVLLYEQLYRAYTIRRGEPYHRGP